MDPGPFITCKGWKLKIHITTRRVVVFAGSEYWNQRKDLAYYQSFATASLHNLDSRLRRARVEGLVNRRIDEATGREEVDY